MGFMEFVRKTRKVPAKRGRRVRTYLGDGTITRATPFGNILVRLPGHKVPIPFHPNEVEYLERE